MLVSFIGIFLLASIIDASFIHMGGVAFLGDHSEDGVSLLDINTIKSAQVNAAFATNKDMNAQYVVSMPHSAPIQKSTIQNLPGAQIETDMMFRMFQNLEKKYSSAMALKLSPELNPNQSGSIMRYDPYSGSTIIALPDVTKDRGCVILSYLNFDFTGIHTYLEITTQFKDFLMDVTEETCNIQPPPPPPDSEIRETGYLKRPLTLP
eukprot:GHVL01003463.1.p1 GENE.GHVL01003463.1~~GHVL01003463.1.p1  ORF type:complete len:207 (-),score=39.31 GHVL01003463.1:12-632(-)